MAASRASWTSSCRSSVWWWLLLLLLLGAAPSVTPFVPLSERSTAQGMVAPPAKPTLEPPVPKESPAEERRARYELGIGRNLPVNVNPSTVHLWDAMDAGLAVRYLEEYVGVVKYPSPSRSTNQQNGSLPSGTYRAHYDLGIGKNPPLNSPVEPSVIVDQWGNSETAVQYLEEYESVVEYPSPLLRRPQESCTGSKKKHLPIKPHRFSVDLIDIFDCGGGSGAAPPVAYAHRLARGLGGGRRVRHRPWDLNTPWVEMLIHEQQMQVAAG